MSRPIYWQEACDHLATNDWVMASLIDNYRGEFLRSRGNPFETLLRSVVGQQISVKAADSVWQKLKDICEVEGGFEPSTVLHKNNLELLRAGLSRRKVEYAKGIAGAFFEGSLAQCEWDVLSDDEVIQKLVALRGIGRWSAEMFLIFALLRPNVFPLADLGLQKALSLNYSTEYPLSKDQLLEFQKRFAPWCTVATWYLWRALDPIPVEY